MFIIKLNYILRTKMTPLSDKEKALISAIKKWAEEKKKVPLGSKKENDQAWRDENIYFYGYNTSLSDLLTYLNSLEGEE